MIGTKLAHYEITTHLGSGGMGDVYQATDTKLGRNVAIKFLPEAFSHDTERVARFQREARVLASLNHSNIAGIYGVEEIDSRYFLVMELVSGETLADRIKHGAIPIEEALPIAKQIAEALEEAHEKGIIHRDLKPANIKLTRDGKVKVLDFGLAKAYEREQTNPALTNSPTISMAATNAGVILGTAAYMSPEQARGENTDKRTDVFSFGCVLYEMLTGKQAFQGNTVSDILASVLAREPDFTSLPPDLNSRFYELLRRCLDKNAQRRWHDIADLKIDLEMVAANPRRKPEAVAHVTPRRRIREHILWTSLALVSIVAAVLAFVHFRGAPPAASRTVTRFSIALPPNVSLFTSNGGRPSIALSPDGTRLVYIARAAGTGNYSQLYSRTIDQLDAVPIRGTEDAQSFPFFSPDGQWIGFFSADGKLKKVPAGGGAAFTVCDAIAGLGATWLPDDSIIFRPGTGVGLWRVSAAGGTPQELLKPDGKSEVSFFWPEALPDGKAILFTIQRGNPTFNNAAIGLLRLDTRERFLVVEGGAQPHYLPGHLVFARDDQILALPFDARTLQTKGAPVAVLEGVLRSSGQLSVNFTASAKGSIAYISGGNEPLDSRSLVWVNRDGAVQPVPAPKRNYEFPRLSPDGQRVAVRINGGSDFGQDIWLYEFARGTLSRFTSQFNDSETPVWSPDGKRVAFAVTAITPARQIMWKLADGSAREEVLVGSDRHLHLGGWSPKGDAVIAMATDAGNVWTLQLTDKPTLRPLIQTSYQVRAATISPEGRWLAYSSNDTNRFEVYVQAFPNPGGKYQISTEGGAEPIWAKNGRELFYRNGDKMMVVAIGANGDSLEPGTPKLLFEGRFAVSFASGGDAWYDVSPDGQRFLMLKSEDAPNNSANIVMVQDWVEELKRLVPSR
jgi:serine/threonine protein kinase/WD40 repeat protein